MEITEIRIKLVSNRAERLRAFCSITLDGDFVIRDIKIIDGANGAFVAMPSRKLADRCPSCGCKNHLRAKFCNDCGGPLDENRAARDAQGRARLHADIAHPINAACREWIQKKIVEQYEEEVEQSRRPDYKPPTYDEFDEGGTDDYESLIDDLKREANQRQERRTAPREERPTPAHEPVVPAEEDAPPPAPEDFGPPPDARPPEGPGEPGPEPGEEERRSDAPAASDGDRAGRRPADRHRAPRPPEPEPRGYEGPDDFGAGIL